MAGIHRETAKIYEFPLMQRRRLDNGLTAPAASKEVIFSVVDTCWYHGEAIREDEHAHDTPKPC